MELQLCFSGGGFRATFFCLGAYRRLVELNLHDKVAGISSVSGGSITAGQILCALKDGRFNSVSDFDKRVSNPLIKIGQLRLRNKLMSKLLPWTPPRRRFSQCFPQFLDKHLFNNITLKELPDYPEWSVNASCLNTGKRFRFKKKNVGGNLLGVTEELSDLKISQAVASSAGFPMMFAPFRLSTEGLTFYFKWWTDKHEINKTPLPKTLFLSDGGVYDNLGSESILRKNRPFLIFDASGFLEKWDPKKNPNWLTRNWRPLDTGLDQVVLLRRRLLYAHAQKVKGYQLILRDPIEFYIYDPERYGKLSDKQFKTPQYDLMATEHQYYLGRMRTDLDGFHAIEIQSLLWAGAIRVDIAVKLYFQHQIDQNLIEDTPDLPNFPDEKITGVLKKGMERSYIKQLHKKLR
jgi:predicted acylesterase/phospholipase RssA